ncbi:MAG TPA: glycosyltransferase N-terminal domain-containing protein [Chthoniobacteraceae bacterium]|nr:glycosyltransferase N-terminal domain-containing protein [Chthoniobacteraceae bacterium]
MTNKQHVTLPADARRSLRIYNCLFPLLFVALLPGYLLRMVRRGGFRSKFGQRLGWFSAEDRARLGQQNLIWVHSISVGETLLALKIIRQIRKLEPECAMVLSVTTSTGFAVAHAAATDWLQVIYNPLDLRTIARCTLLLVRPNRLIFIEAIWPNLLAEAVRNGVPTTFLPRLSPRSERRFRRFAAFTGPLFRLLDGLAVAEPEDVERWRALGVSGARVRVTGNSKFDAEETPPTTAGFAEVLRACGVGEHAPILLGGSTFPGEERTLAEVLIELRREFLDAFLILVPRHVERSDAIERELSPLGLRIVRRTAKDAVRRNGEPAPRVDVLLVDTTGELRQWYEFATVVFIGKSLHARGGQNPVEPTLAGKPVLFGPHMQNFEPIVSQWLAAKAAVQIHNPAELRDAVAALWRDPLASAELASRARDIAAAHRGAIAKTAECLLGRS